MGTTGTTTGCTCLDRVRDVTTATTPTGATWNLGGGGQWELDPEGI